MGKVDTSLVITQTNVVMDGQRDGLTDGQMDNHTDRRRQRHYLEPKTNPR